MWKEVQRIQEERPLVAVEVQEIGCYKGKRGIWRNKKSTTDLTPLVNGIWVGVLSPGDTSCSACCASAASPESSMSRRSFIVGCLNRDAPPEKIEAVPFSDERTPSSLKFSSPVKFSSLWVG